MCFLVKVEFPSPAFIAHPSTHPPVLPETWDLQYFVFCVCFNAFAWVRILLSLTDFKDPNMMSMWCCFCHMCKSKLNIGYNGGPGVCA